MITSATQLKAKIRNLSSEKSADSQLLLRIYMMERFLERVATSRYSEKIILKGGLLVTSLVGVEARSTMDIDTTIQGLTVNPAEIRDIINEIIKIDIGDGVIFATKSISTIMDEAEYPGVRVGLISWLDGVKVPLKVDISTGDIITPHAIEYDYTLMFEERSIRLKTYNLETVLAEKLETVIRRANTNTRMRDFYDIDIISRLYWNDIESNTLNEALNNTSAKRESQEFLKQTDSVLTDLNNDIEMQRLWQNYQSKFDYARDTTWEEVIKAVHKLATLGGLLTENKLADNNKTITSMQQLSPNNLTPELPRKHKRR